MNNDVIKLLQDRYFLQTENTWEQVAKRVSEIHQPIFNDIKELRFVPSSPTLMNANTKERLGTLSSCFPLDITDSIEGIYGALQDGAVVTKFGGGIGYDFSELRSSFETIKSIKRNSSGPLPFINVFNATLDGIQQGGVRRGAGMALLSIYHPDILSFVRAKAKLSKYNRFNFSVKIDDAFYEKLKNTPDEIHKVKLKDETFIELQDGDKPVSVKKLWNEIIYHAWKVAEPGIFNETIAYNQCANTNISNKVISNPCVTGDTILITSNGEMTIKEIIDAINKSQEVFVLSFSIKENNVEFQKVLYGDITQEKANVIQIETENGQSIKLTPTHKVFVENKGWVEAKDLSNDDVILTIKKI